MTAWANAATLALGLLQTLALVFFAGMLTKAVQEHDRRIGNVEEAIAPLREDVSNLKGRAGLA